MSSNDSGSSIKYYPEEELAALVRSLDRPKDQQLFSVDVLITYPSLAEQYVRVCPQRCDLTTAAHKALDGEYSYDQKLEKLKADVQLMVNNCVRFNGDDHPLSEVAADFEKFALQKIDGYLTGKLGGRRVSSLRLQQQFSQTPPTALSATAAATTGTGGGRQAQKGAASVAARASASAASSHGRHKELTKADVVSLVKSLVRREDAGAFEVDVTEVYPELKENYDKVCPVKVNLVMMREKAEKGVYNTTLSAIGASVADSLSDVRADVELISNNCLRFNAQLPDWVRLAQNFRTFAHRKIDDLVLRVAPSLRNTKTGAQAYAAGAASTPRSGVPTSPKVVQVSSDSRSSASPVNSSATESAAVEATAGSKRPRGHEEETTRKTVQWGQKAAAAVAADYAGPTVQTVVTVAPSVCPTPLQPSLAIPERLRRRLISDHVGRDQLRARLTGRTAPFIQVFPPAPAAAVTHAKDGTVTSPQKAAKPEDGQKGGNTPGTHPSADGEADAPRTSTGDAASGVASQPAEKSDASSKPETETAKAAALQPPSADWCVRLTADQSAQAVLDRFRTSIHTFYDTRRHAADFNDPFQYSLQDEALYLKMLTTVEEQFESTFLGVLLYAQEAADVHEWVSFEALKKAASATVPPSGTVAEAADGKHVNAEKEEEGPKSSVGTGTDVVRWAPAVHYTYLVRFLVQLPQMASLCSASLSSSTGPNGTQAPVVKVSREALTMLGRVTQFTSEFLSFIAEYEETLLGSANMAKPLTAPASD